MIFLAYSEKKQYFCRRLVSCAHFSKAGAKVQQKIRMCKYLGKNFNYARINYDFRLNSCRSQDSANVLSKGSLIG